MLSTAHLILSVRRLIFHFSLLFAFGVGVLCHSSYACYLLAQSSNSMCRSLHTTHRKKPLRWQMPILAADAYFGGRCLLGLCVAWDLFGLT
jgi:hypothetical protein